MSKRKRKKKKAEKSEQLEIQAGSLRERVRSGELKAPDVLGWLEEQDYQSLEFERWLENKCNRTVLSDRDRDVFVEIMDNDEPSEALIRTADKYKELENKRSAPQDVPVA